MRPLITGVMLCICNILLGQSIPASNHFQQNTTALAATGQVWGFLKYHHPYVASGNINWDNALLNILPAIQKAQSTLEWQTILDQWVDSLPVPEKCISCKNRSSKNELKLEPDYGAIFKPDYLLPGTAARLNYLLHEVKMDTNYYVGLVPKTDNPVFKNELPYATSGYPEEGLRLLALFRYWNMIQYFAPYRYLADNWNSALEELIPSFINARDSLEYSKACISLVKRVNDSHSSVWTQSWQEFLGVNLSPVKVSFIENKLVVLQVYADTNNLVSQLPPGTVITHINGKKVSDRLEELRPYLPASNESGRLRDVSLLFSRDTGKLVELTVSYLNQSKKVLVPYYWYPYWQKLNRKSTGLQDTGFTVLEGNIAYLNPGSFGNMQPKDFIEKVKNTKAMVVDMRCYPAPSFPFSVIRYIKGNSLAFAAITCGDISSPGKFYFKNTVRNQGKSNGSYKKKIVVLVNSYTQSAAEYLVMALQTNPNVMVVGSQTAGADGNASSIVLPGNVKTLISGLGVYYPNKAETQGAGLHIDHIIQPTIAGIIAGKDEQMEKAIELLNTQP